MTTTSAASERDQAFSRLGSTHYDVLVIGGGVTGCGIARDAALRGFEVALVEKEDLGAGTSSKSSKLVHGGLRYLEHAEFKLVFEGVNERQLLQKRAPHLVRPMPFLVPAYKESKHGRVALDVGLWIYDALSGFSSPKLHKAYKSKALLALEPGLRTEALKGGAIYYDCATDDARLTLENALDARALGAEIVTYARASSLLKDGSGRIIGVEVESREPGRPASASGASPSGASPSVPPPSVPPGPTVKIRARVTINATGPWSDEVRALLGEKPLLRPTKGVHIVLDAARLAPRHAVVMLARRDHRLMFAIPWGDRTVIGTTDTDYKGDLDHVFADADDVAYLLETANHYFPEAKLGPADVLATWAGLRPLVAPGADISESDVSREHHLIERPGFITIAGGKLTTYRRMALEVVDRAGQQLGRIPKSGTEARPLPGAAGVDGDDGLTRIAAALVEKYAARGIDERVARHLSLTYGARAEAVAARIDRDPTAGAHLEADTPYLFAEIDEAVEHELARTLTDVLGRRVPLLLRSRDQGLGVSRRVAERIAPALDWDAARIADEVARYRAVVEETRKFRTA